MSRVWAPSATIASSSVRHPFIKTCPCSASAAPNAWPNARIASRCFSSPGSKPHATTIFITDPTSAHPPDRRPSSAGEPQIAPLCSPNDGLPSSAASSARLLRARRADRHPVTVHRVEVGDPPVLRLAAVGGVVLDEDMAERDGDHGVIAGDRRDHELVDPGPAAREALELVGLLALDGRQDDLVGALRPDPVVEIAALDLDRGELPELHAAREVRRVLLLV